MRFGLISGCLSKLSVIDSCSFFDMREEVLYTGTQTKEDQSKDIVEVMITILHSSCASCRAFVWVRGWLSVGKCTLADE